MVDWNPRYLYQNHFKDEKEMEYFLMNICTDEWNLEQDKGRPLAEGTRILQQKFPEFHDLINLYYEQWELMLRSDIPETVSLLYTLKKKYKLYGLTNWSAETIPVAFERYAFFKEFDGIVGSGVEKMIKPEKEFYHLLFNRYDIKAEHSIFIDDNIKNVVAGEEIGMLSIHFQGAILLEEKLKALNII